MSMSGFFNFLNQHHDFAKSRSRSRRRGLSRIKRWESLGLGMDERLGGTEALESRLMLASDLALTIDNSVISGIERDYVEAGSQVSYQIEVTNAGTSTASADLTVQLPDAIGDATWAALYDGGATGPVIGAAGPVASLTLPAGSSALFELYGKIASDAEGEIAVSGQLVEGTNTILAGDTDQVLPDLVAVSDSVGWYSTPEVKLVDAQTGDVVHTFNAFEEGFRGGVETAVADLNGDGHHDVVVASGRGRVAEVKVFSLNTETNQYEEVSSFRPFEDTYSGGLSLAVADFNGDGQKDIAVSKAMGNGQIAVFFGDGSRDFSGRDADISFVPVASNVLGGTRIAAADLGVYSGGSTQDADQQDGRDELIMATGPTVSALVRTYDLSSGTPVVLNSISPFDADLKGGVSITTGRYDADSIPEIVVTAGRKGNAATKVISAKGGTTSTLVELSGNTLAEGASVQSLRTPRIALADGNGDGRFDTLLASQGSPDVNGNAALSRFTLDESGVTRDQSSVLAAAFSSLGSSLVSVPLQVINPAYTTTSTGLRYRDIQVGTGNQPASSSDSVTVNYEGWLLDGTRFDGNDDISFPLNGVIAGWTEGLSTMREGGIRELYIPSDLAYGDSGTGSIPGGATLVFRVELLGINGSTFRPPLVPS